MGPNKKYAQSIYGNEPSTMDELAHAVIKVINCHQEHRVSARGKLTSSPKAQCVGLSWRVTHSDHVSNSHSSPEGYPQNFMRKEGVPTGYPGWTGRVWVRYRKEEGYSFGSDPFRRTLTHTGTGGGGSYDGPWKEVSSARFHRYGHNRGKDTYPEINCYSWDFRIYDVDWPIVSLNIITEYEKERTWAILANKPMPSPPIHSFTWEDPEIVVADAQFLKECKEMKVAA